MSVVARSRLAHVLLAVGLALVAAAPAPASATRSDEAAGSSGAVFTLPVPDGTVLRLFLAPAVRWGPGHRGVDLAVPTVPTVPTVPSVPSVPHGTHGGVVRAPADGTVTFAGHVVDRGVLTITHPGGLRSSLEPVVALHPVGTTVRRGEAVAVVEPGIGHCPSSCVHWGVRRGTGRPDGSGTDWEYVDPLSLLAPREVRLLPWD